MSAPIPVIETPKPNLDFKNKKSFKLASNKNLNYIFSLSYNEKLILFEIEKEGEFPKKEYNLFLDLDQLYKINKYFNQFENFSDIQTSFETLIEMKKLNINDNENDKVLKINIINPLNKKEFNIDIPLKEKTLKNEIDSIIPYIVSLKDKINVMENRINILENKVNELYLIKEEFSKLKNNKTFNEKNNIFFPKSIIIKPEDENVILNWFDKSPKKFNLIFDTKIDGDLISTFYKKCENKKPLILFFQTTKGARFGGFTSEFFHCANSGYINDAKCFLFSLDKKEKYKQQTQIRSLCCRNEYFQFGVCCFRIYNNCTSIDRNYINNDKNYFDIPENYGLTGGEKTFRILSYEVYQIDF
jgi:hypothetical protein